MTGQIMTEAEFAGYLTDSPIKTYDLERRCCT